MKTRPPKLMMLNGAEDSPRYSIASPLRYPELGAARKIQEITETKVGMTKAMPADRVTSSFPGVSVRATIQASGIPMAQAPAVTAATRMQELTVAETMPRRENALVIVSNVRLPA